MDRFIQRHAAQAYDILVIGGGITGAAVAYEAASRGFSVALVEKGDFGAATSAATSKLIHGGLRYLANLEFGLVRESLRERKILENIAPNLVYPIPFLIPLYEHRLNKWVVEPGMIMYDILSYDKAFTWDPSKKIPLHRLLSRQQALQQEPVINAQRLTGAILYYDCASLSPERLTLAFIKSAIRHGAAVLNYARVEDFVRDSGGICGVVVRDLLNDHTAAVKARLTINCAGPWADLVLDRARGKPGAQHVRRSEGIHIIVPSLSQRCAIGAQTASGRSCNIIPWRNHSLIGTTDQEYTGDPDDYRVTRAKIEAYIGEVNEAFGNPKLVKYSDVLYAYGGLRPLVEDQTREVYKTSRKYEIYDNARDGLPGLITVEGGKYTTSRSLAENVLKMVCAKFAQPYKKSVTAGKYLAGSEIRDINAFVAEAKSAYPDFSEARIDYLARIYGAEIKPLMDIARSDPRYAQPLNPDGEMLAQVLYAIRHEMAQTLTDILLRRTGLGTLGYPQKDVMDKIIAAAAHELQWSPQRIEREAETAAAFLCTPL